MKEMQKQRKKRKKLLFVTLTQKTNETETIFVTFHLKRQLI
jgi:hypothetical protein